MIKKFRTFFNVRAEESRLVFFVLAYYLAIGIATVLTNSPAYALFLVEFDSEMLPYIYIASSIGVVLASFLYIRVSTYLSLERLWGANLAVLMLLLILVRVGLAVPGSKWLIFMLPVVQGVLATLTNLAFWQLAGSLFNVRQGKRLFGLFSGSYQLGRVMGGFLIPILVARTGTVNIFFFAAGTMFVVWFLLHSILRTNTTPLVVEKSKQKQEAPKERFSLLKNRYVLLMFLSYGLTSFGYLFADNIYYDQAAKQFPDEAQLTSFIGLFFAMIGGMALFSGTFLTPRIIGRYGVKIGVLIGPLVLMMISALMALVSTFSGETVYLFGLALAAKAWDWTYRKSIDKPCLNILYQPLPPDQRQQTQVINDGLVYPVAMILSGGLLLLLTKGLGVTVVQLGYGLFFISVVIVFVSISLGRLYPTMLIKALQKSPQRGFDMSPLNKPTLAVLQENLQSTKSGHETALRTLATVGKNNAFAEVSSYLDDANQDVRSGAMVGSLRNGCLASILAAGQKLLEMVDSPQPAERVFAAQILGQAGVVRFYIQLEKLLLDNEPQVQRAALEAVGQLRPPELWPLVVQALQRSKVRPTATAALVAGGEAVLPAIKTAFHKEQEPALLLQLVEICGCIGGMVSIAFLEKHLDHQDEKIRTQIFKSLSRCGYQAQEEKALRRIQRQLRAEVAEATSTLAAIVELGAHETVTFLKSTQTDTLSQQRDRVFYLLSFITNSSAILSAREHLNEQSTSEKEAYALELLDVLVPNELKRLIFPLLDDLTPKERLQRLSHIFPQPKLKPEPQAIGRRFKMKKGA